MKIKLFTFTFDPARGGFDDSEMAEFLRGNEALAVVEHFFVHEQLPRWSLMVTYRESAPAARAAPAGERRPARTPKTDWRKELDPSELALFDALRAWRAQASRRDGVSAFMVATNRQLAGVARRRPTTPAALLELEGFGEGRVRRWGAEMLSVVASTPQAPAAPAAPPESEPQAPAEPAVRPESESSDGG